MQYDDPSYAGGANKESLNEARSNYKAFGAVNKKALLYVRQPTQEEMNNERN